MNQNSTEIFRRLLASMPYIYEGGNCRERTDAELDALVSYAVRADAACVREQKRYAAEFAAKNPVPRPAPTSVPSVTDPVPERQSAVVDLARFLFGGR